jgi:hypothetical protein
MRFKGSQTGIASRRFASFKKSGHARLISYASQVGYVLV